MAPPPPLLPLVLLLMVVGASGEEWRVTYNQSEICALNGSTVFMNGSFEHPEGLSVTEKFWIIDPETLLHWSDLREDSKYSARVEYLFDEPKNFSLKLSNVMKKDERQYCFRIITNVEKQRYLGRTGVRLSVTELHVKSPEEVTEGEPAVLTCSTTCSLTDPTFIWFKDGRPLPTNITQKNQLHLQTVSSEDTGSYSCAVRGSDHLHSTAQTLRVRHPPKNVSVSINSSSPIVTLTCSSDAYPPVENYTWFKEGGGSPVGFGPTYVPLQNGSYYCQAENQHGAQRSAAVISGTLKDHSVILYAAVGVGGVCGFAVFLIVCFSIRKRQDEIDEQVYANVKSRAHPPDDDDEEEEEDSTPDYENVPNSKQH